MRTLLLFTVLTCLASCYGPQKAAKQHGRAVTTFPQIGADWCAKTYPVEVDTILIGDSIIHLDTLWGEGQTYYDTLLVRDTLRITKIIEKPLYITKTVHRVDTLFKESAARLDQCALARDVALRLLEKKTEESDNWESKAKKRFWVILGMGATMLIGLFLALRKKIKL